MPANKNALLRYKTIDNCLRATVNADGHCKTLLMLAQMHFMTLRESARVYQPVPYSSTFR